jgi:hypothetical protein
MAEVVRIQLRRGTKAEWDSSSDVVLAIGEVGVETSPTASDVKFKVGNGQATWENLPYFLNSASIDQAVSVAVATLVDSAPSTLDTLNELAAALGDDPEFATTILGELSDLSGEIGLKADSSHQHTVSDITDFAHTHLKQDITDFAHTHTISEISELSTELSEKANLTGASFTGEVSATSFRGSVGTTTTSLNFSTQTFKTITLSTTTTFTASNYAAGRTVTVRVNPGASTRTIGFPSGWVFVGTKPTSIAANKIGILTITSFGTTEAECVAAWAVQS